MKIGTFLRHGACCTSGMLSTHRSKRALGALAVCAALTWIAEPAAAQGIVVVSGLQTPVAFARHPTDPAVWFVAQQNGVVWLIRDRVRLPTPFLNLSASGANITQALGERGLLGLAFPLDYATSGRFYVYYTAAGNSPQPAGSSVVSRLRRSDGNPDVADVNSRLDIQWSTGVRHILMRDANTTNHNGGCLGFGPDGYLYIAVGDSGGGGDPLNSAQNAQSLRGKMLRIDVSVPDSNTAGMIVPPTNPFLDGVPITALPEIWDFGLRNPWKFSFDNPALGGTGALLIADVGQGAREEVNYEPAGLGGRNYGWAMREGLIAYPAPPGPAAYMPLTDPILDYGRISGASVTGGYVYRGSRMPSARGRYYFADFISGRVWSSVLSASGTPLDSIDHTAELGGSAVLGNISGFGEDFFGELYVLNYTAGTIVAIHPLTAPTNLRVVR
jgi:glucose/arabinose dehydrogenase